MSDNFRELIQKAIAIEAKMAEFYGKMAEEATTRKPARFSKSWPAKKKNTEPHWKTMRRKVNFPKFPRIGESDLEPTLKVVGSITPDMAPADALAFAIRSEEYQHRFYKKLAQEYPPGLTQNFLKRLADMELVHKEKVEKLHRWFSRFQEQLITDT